MTESNAGIPEDFTQRLNASVANWKRKLLDLSRRNRALNFKSTRVSTVAIVDEQPAEVFRHLYLDEATMQFRALDPVSGDADGEETTARRQGEQDETVDDSEEGSDAAESSEFVPYDSASVDERHRDEWLQDVTEAYEAAERLERETESEFEAWKLLLDTMKAADAAQASNLGQVLAPAVASRFETLTAKRYASVRLTSQLQTEGVVVGGVVRPAERLSVGTREQLSTLYRLSLAEYLVSSVVLDDQLVQSDDQRMDWFRELLVEKSSLFQVIVFTCRPGDYLAQGEEAPLDGSSLRTGSVHAVNLNHAIQHR